MVINTKYAYFVYTSKINCIETSENVVFTSPSGVGLSQTIKKKPSSFRVLGFLPLKMEHPAFYDKYKMSGEKV